MVVRTLELTATYVSTISLFIVILRFHHAAHVTKLSVQWVFVTLFDILQTYAVKKRHQQLHMYRPAASADFN
jgi:hypothetical protein